MARTIHRWFGFLRGRAEQRVSGLSAPRQSVNSPVQAMSPAAHLDRVCAVLQVSFARIEAVNGCQALARQQLDVADYTLQRLIEDLRTVMPGIVPGMIPGAAAVVRSA